MFIMANIRKRGRKWQVQVRRAGHLSQTKTFLRKEDAIAWGRQQEVRLEAVIAGTYLPIKETLAELLVRYAKEITPHKKSEASEQRRIKRLLRDPISNNRICNLTPDKLAIFRDKRLNDGRRAAAYDLQIIRHTLNIASSEWGMFLKENPLDRVRFPSPPKPREKRLKPGELQKLLQSANQSGSSYMPSLIILAVETGMRIGELLKIEWSDWDKQRAILHLRNTKNGRDRYIPLTPKANQIISDITQKSDRILPTNYEAVKSAWQRLRKRTGILDLRLHDLRHEATSRFFEMGLTLPEVASITGHQTATMLLRYAHADVQKVRQKISQQE
jgi:integrase